MEQPGRGATCGITLTGFNLGIGAGGGNGGLYINGNGQPPTGYTLPAIPQGTF